MRISGLILDKRAYGGHGTRGVYKCVLTDKYVMIDDRFGSEGGVCTTYKGDLHPQWEYLSHVCALGLLLSDLEWGVTGGEDL